MVAPVQQYPNSYGRPDCTLRADYVNGSGLLQVDECPLGCLITGPKYQVKVGGTLFDVMDIGSFPHRDWTVVGGVENTSDTFDYGFGTGVYLEHTRGAMEAIRQASVLTFEDETVNGWPNSVPVDSLDLADFGSAKHRDLGDVDPNQHHRQFHDHTDPLDSADLFPNILFVQQQFALSGHITVPQLTANVNDLQPDGGDEASLWLMTSDASRAITGIAYPQVWTFMHIISNKGANDIVFKHEDSGSLPDHRFQCPDAVDFTLGPGHSAWLFFDADDYRIRILA